MTDSHPFCYQVLTPPGRGAIAVISVWGNDCLDAIDHCFRPAGSKKFKDLKRDLVYGVWVSTGEDLLVVRESEQQYEIQCHGSVAAIDAITTDLKHRGALVKPPGHLNQLKFHSKVIRRENICQIVTQDITNLIIAASTERTATRLLQQLPVLPEAMARLRQSWPDGLPDNGSDPTESSATDEQIDLIRRMLAWSDFGTSFHQPRSVVFYGAPNAGKSRLTNRFLGYDRTIVNAMPGTTRDVITQTAAVDGWPVKISDTAGIRDANGEVERLGIEKAKQEIAKGDLVIGVVDATAVQAFEFATPPNMLLINKSDLVSKSAITTLQQHLRARWPALETVVVSAETGHGFDAMMKTIARLLTPSLPPTDHPIPLLPWHVDFLNRWLGWHCS